MIQSSDFDYNNYIGKPISEFDNIISSHKGKDVKFNRLGNIESQLYGNSINRVILLTNEANIVIKIKLNFNSILDNKFYEHMVKEYGQPEKILKADQLLSEKSVGSKRDGVTQKYSIKKTDIYSEPLLIEFKSEGLSVRIKFNYFEKVTSLQFIKN